MQPGVALDVQLIDHALGQRRPPCRRHRRRRVGHHDAERDGGEGVVAVGDEVRLRCVVEDRPGVVDAAGDGAGVRIEEQFGWVEAGAGGRIPGTVDPESVALLRLHARHEHGPDAVVAAGHVLVVLAAVLGDQRELDPGGARSPEAEGRAPIADVRPEHRGIGRHRQWLNCGCHIETLRSGVGCWRSSGGTGGAGQVPRVLILPAFRPRLGHPNFPARRSYGVSKPARDTDGCKRISR